MTISLPLESESVRCADFAREHQVDPGGTALAPDVVVLVEVVEPWPKPATKHPALVDIVAQAAVHPEQVRILAAVPHDAERPRIIALRPTAGGMARAEVEMGSHPAADLRAVLRTDIGSVVGGSHSARAILVCTQGSHDVCCGSDGGEFADDLVRRHPDLELFRVSHTGGHRFAPTAMTLPDGRMWAYLTGAIMEMILDRSLEPSFAATLCRGWWGASTGPAQIGERAVFAAKGWEVDHLERSAFSEPEDDGSHRVLVSVASERWEVTVAPGRQVPTISCEVPGGEPVKPGREWAVAHGPTRIG